MAAQHHADFTYKKVTAFSAISVYLMAIPYCDEARGCSRLACGTWAQLLKFIYAESEITSLVPHAGPVQLSIVCRQYILLATESWAGAWEQDYSFSTQCESESCLPMHMITAKKRSQLRSDHS